MTFKTNEISLILSESDLGAGIKGAGKGPEALIEELQSLDINFGPPASRIQGQDASKPNVYPFCKNIESVRLANTQLAEAVESAVKLKTLPLILSGDHSNAIGGVSGLKEAYPDKRIGVIWIDAHADLHSPYTTPSGNIHGMPLAALLGADNLSDQINHLSPEEILVWEDLKKLGHLEICPKLLASDIVFIGIRDAETPEWNYIEKNEICTFEPEDIRSHGIYSVLNKSLEHLEACDILYVSFDADSIDPEISSGTGTTAADGLSLTEAEAVFKVLMNSPQLAAFEITEINPSLDKQSRKMANVIASLVHFGLNG